MPLSTPKRRPSQIRADIFSPSVFPQPTTIFSQKISLFRFDKLIGLSGFAKKSEIKSQINLVKESNNLIETFRILSDALLYLS